MSNKNWMPELKARLYDKLQSYKIKINWNKNPIKMDVFLSFLTIPVERSYDHLGSDTGWTRLNNKEHKLIIGGGIVGNIEYLDTIQYGTKLSNQYNNYVNPFYLFDILTKEGQAFFLEYYSNEIDVIVSAEKDGIAFQERKIAHNKKILKAIEQKIELLKSNCNQQKQKMEQTVDWLKNNIEPLLIIGAQIKIGRRYVKEVGGFKPGEVITLIEGFFERDNGLYSVTETAPSIWNKDSEDFDSIYHLFGNDLEYWYDCKIVKPTTNGKR